MKKTIFLILLCLNAFLYALNIDDIQDVLKRPNNVHGNFIQKRYLQHIANPLITQGNFFLIREQGLLWEMNKPFTSITRIYAKGIEQWSDTNEQWIKSNNDSQNHQINLFLNLFDGNFAELKKQFNIKTDGNINNWNVVLIPKGLLKQIFIKIEISGNNLIKNIKIFEKQGDKIFIEFNNIILNSNLNEKYKKFFKY